MQDLQSFSCNLCEGRNKELAVPVHLYANPQSCYFPSTDLKAKYAWISEASDFSKSIYATISYTTELMNKTNAVMQAIHETPGASAEMMNEAERINSELDKIMFIFNGPTAKAK